MSMSDRHVLSLLRPNLRRIMTKLGVFVFLSLTFVSYSNCGKKLNVDAKSVQSSGSPAPDQCARAVGQSPPALLSQTCLYANIGDRSLSTYLREYEPVYPLWSDGARKTRWIYLPPGKQINSDNMDQWVFPVGTQIFKEFVRDGLNIETRYITKTSEGTGPEHWEMVTYAWRADQTDADALYTGSSADDGWLHSGLKIPTILPTGSTISNAATNQCLMCHKGATDFVLGFEALQLSQGIVAGKLTLSDLSNMGKLTTKPAHDFAIPGSAATRDALGYMHSNCASCHNANPNRAASNITMNLRHNLDIDAIQHADAQLDNGYKDTVGVAVQETGMAATYGSKRIAPHDLTQSMIYGRTNKRGAGQMPPAGFAPAPYPTPAPVSSVIDQQGIIFLQAWINEL